MEVAPLQPFCGTYFLLAHAKGLGMRRLGIRRMTYELGAATKKDIMGKAVYNDNNEKIGDVNDVIFSRNNSASFVVVGVGGFLGMGEHDVAVPLSRIKHDNDKLILPGATKEALKKMPEFQYAKMDKSERTDNKTDRK